MAKVTDKPAARTFRVGERAPTPAKKPAPPAQPALATARRELPPFAKGLGVDQAAASMLARELAPIPLESLGAGAAAAPDGMGLLAKFPGCAVPSPAAAFTCSEQTFDFLASNVLRNSDIVPVVRSGYINFDRALGVHSIPLDEQETNGQKFPGDLLVPDTQALIVTSFTPFAALTMPGLPGAYTSVDPFSLLGQVAFYLVADNGVHPLAERSVTEGDVVSGTEIVNAPEISGDAHPPYTDVIKTSVGAAYKVFHSPYPGFPSVVGVRLRGYMINQQLLAEALDNRSRRSGG